MASQRKILVTGASGFIGGHLCAALASRGDRVRALYRRRVPPASLAALAESRGGASVELFNADLLDPRRAAEAVAGMDAVIHVAARAVDWGSYELFKRQNYDATAILLEAAEKGGAKGFLYFSSTAVSGFGPHLDSTEEGPYYPLKYPYPSTKRLAERLVLARNRPGFKTVAVRPGNVYGPGDRTTTYRMFDAILSGVFGYIGSGEAFTCPVFIDDLCAGVVAALERDEAAGEAFILTDGEKVSWKDYAEAMFEAVGSRKRAVHTSEKLAVAAAGAMEFVARAIGEKDRPPLTRYAIDQVARNYHFSNAKARSVLGFEPKVFYREGIAITARAYLQDRARERADRSRPAGGRAADEES